MRWAKNYKVGLLLFISIAINIYYFIQIKNIKDQVINNKDTLTKIYTTSNTHLKHVYTGIFESNFKDDLVLNSFNNSITIVITFFTVLIALGGYLSFKKIEDDIENLNIITTDFKNTEVKINEARAKIENAEIKINKAQTKIENAEIKINEAQTKIEYAEQNLYNYIIVSDTDLITLIHINVMTLLKNSLDDNELLVNRRENIVTSISYYISITNRAIKTVDMLFKAKPNLQSDKNKASLLIDLENNFKKINKELNNLLIKYPNNKDVFYKIEVHYADFDKDYFLLIQKYNFKLDFF